MIRAAFVYRNLGDSWLGGVSYLRNLLGALLATPEAGVKPLLLASPRSPPPRGFPEVDLVQTRGLDVRDRLAFVWNRLGREYLLDHLLERYGADVLSHSGYLGRYARTPAIAWIPDVQHRRLPELFPESERRMRDALFSRTLGEATRVIVSSEAARRDVLRFFPGHAGKLRVLRFVDSFSAGAEATPREALEARYGFRGRFFLLPNQYWAHKNHAVVLDALAILRRSGREVLVLSTGSSADHRQPGFFGQLMQRRTRLGLEQAYRVLGVVPFADLAGLMRAATAVVNPSRFEGWSTSVEEAKSLGRRVVLSDIEVHREQAPARGTFFDPDRPDQLAEALWTIFGREDAEEEAAFTREAAEALPIRRARFAADYAEIARDAASERVRRRTGSSNSSTR